MSCLLLRRTTGFTISLYGRAKVDKQKADGSPSFSIILFFSNGCNRAVVGAGSSAHIDGIGFSFANLKTYHIWSGRDSRYLSFIILDFFMNKHHGDFTTTVNFSIATRTVTASKGIIATERAALNQENTLYRYRMLIPK
jgi:hypothetical protein